MSWLYSRALVEAYWEANCSDGEQSAPLNMNPMPPLFLPNDKMTDFSRLSRFGMTFGPLTDDLGADVLTWFLVGFPAKTSAPQDEGQASPESEADYGWKWRESSVKYDPAMRLWKTRQCSLFEDSEWFSETWPRWGLMRDGECWELPTSERPTFERGSGLLPTIRATDGERGGRGDLIQAIRGNPNSHYKIWQTPVSDDAMDRQKGKLNSRGEPKLSAQVKMWPTPDASAMNVGADPQKHMDRVEKLKQKGINGNGAGMTLGIACQLWPTPRAFMHKDSAIDRGKSNSGEKVGGSLNPTWVEWLMGWPLEWTDLKPLGTAKSRNVLP